MLVVIGGRRMEIKKITVSGFRNISSCEFDIDGITGLLAVNSFGKSNILKAIEFGFEFINAPNNSKDLLLGWTQGFPKNVFISTPEFSFDVLLGYSKGSKKYDVKYGFSFEWRINDNKGGRVKNEYLMIKEISNKQKFSYFLKRENFDCFGKYRTSETGRCDKKISIKSNELIINKLLAFDELFYFDIIEKLNDFQIYVDRHLDSAHAYEIEPIIRKDTDDLKLATADNIPRTLYKLKEKYRDKYEYLMDIYLQLFPKIDNIQVKRFKISGSPDTRGIPDEFEFIEYAYLLFCKEKNMNSEINFQGMSDGAKRILLLLTNLILADINGVSLFCVEEPENCINPSLFQKYIEVIHDLRGHVKIIITSHSPYLVNYLDPREIYIGCNNDKDLAEFKRIKKTSINKLYADSQRFNVDYAEYLFDLFANSDEDLNKYVE